LKPVTVGVGFSPKIIAQRWSTLISPRDPFGGAGISKG
jgi:hypothetical protein